MKTKYIIMKREDFEAEPRGHKKWQAVPKYWASSLEDGRKLREALELVLWEWEWKLVKVVEEDVD